MEAPGIIEKNAAKKYFLQIRLLSLNMSQNEGKKYFKHPDVIEK
jgi:hypothetical protein